MHPLATSTDHAYVRSGGPRKFGCRRGLTHPFRRDLFFQYDPDIGPICLPSLLIHPGYHGDLW